LKTARESKDRLPDFYIDKAGNDVNHLSEADGARWGQRIRLTFFDEFAK